jgi:hypothetical protein
LTEGGKYGHVVMINHIDDINVYIAEGNFDGKNSGSNRDFYCMSHQAFINRGIIGSCIHPSLQHLIMKAPEGTPPPLPPQSSGTKHAHNYYESD